MELKNAMDWPLSREEKKQQLVRLYSGDVQAADSMLSSGEKALEALRDELDAVRRAAKEAGAPAMTLCEASPARAADAEVERLRTAVESAAAVLRAILPSQDDAEPGPEAAEARLRARSEDLSARGKEATTMRPALCRTPRRDRPKRKVSFGGQPEEEPNQVRAQADSDDEVADSTSVVLSAPPKRKHRDSMGLYREKTVATADASEETAAGSLQSPGWRSGMSTHLAWSLGSLCSAVALATWAYQMGSSNAPPGPPTPPVTLFGDPACWVHGYRPDYCCLGPGGNPNCWDEVHTYERCCLPTSEL